MKTSGNINRLLGFVLVAILGSFSGVAYSYIFKPTENEFHLWSYKCKAIYAGTPIGAAMLFTKSIPITEAKKWRQIGELNGGAWHYCAGLIHFYRGKKEINRFKRDRHYTEAFKEISFSYQRLRPNSKMRSEIVTALAEVERARGNYVKAQEHLSRILKRAPGYARAYIVSAFIYRDKKDLNSAKKVLMNGLTDVEDIPAELYYVLGLVMLELKDIKEAKKYAALAYKKGYPLPWLKNKLKEFPDK
ncbi:MAG: tetratricopeptide repeat protein [Flavobacteriaceae bacterium]|nr:tetratricopeptide repeat protein [Flavobacteriaceae bacterium]